MLLHIENRTSKAAPMQVTPQLMREALERAGRKPGLRWSIGADLAEPAWLAEVKVLVTSNDILVHPDFPRATLAEAAPKLRWIHVTGAGIEPLLPLTWLPKKVVLTNNSGVHVKKTGEFATMALLALNARLPEFVAQQREARWRQIFTPSIAGKTVLVVGLGEMGGAAAKAAKKLGMRVIGVRREAKPHRHVDEVLPLGRLHRALAEADFVWVAAPLTPATRNLLDAAAIGAMKRGAALVNVGRAGVVDYTALAAALGEGRLAGAILDVFDPEPLPPESPLWRVPNLIIWPHCSSDDSDAYMPLTLDLVCRNLARFEAGKRLRNAVDPIRGY